jgi:hypothetical protein
MVRAGSGRASRARWRPNLADIPGLRAWYDPTDPRLRSVDHLGGIDLLIPQVGNTGDFSLTQAVEANRPLVVSFNGKDCIGVPDGTRWLAKASAPLPDRDLGLAMVIAWMATNPDAGVTVCSINRSANPAQRIDLLIQAGQQFAYRYGTFGGDFGQENRPTVPLQMVLSTTFDRTHWLGGGDPRVLAAGTLSPSPNASIELGRFIGVVGHWLIVSGPTITEGWLRQIEGFVAHDLGIQASLVPGHPYKDTPP